jgi:transposase-like protein
MEQRVEFALKALRSGNFRELCQEYGISPKTGYKWRERFLQKGLVGMEEESRRPRSSPLHLDEEEVCEFNYQRPHQALGMRCPAELYQGSTRPYTRSPQELFYPGMATRNLKRRGKISWQGQEFFITTSLAGWSVGLKVTAQEPIEIWFGRLLLGWIDSTSASFLRADLRPLASP